MIHRYSSSQNPLKTIKSIKINYRKEKLFSLHLLSQPIYIYNIFARNIVQEKFFYFYFCCKKRFTTPDSIFFIARTFTPCGFSSLNNKTASSEKKSSTRKNINRVEFLWKKVTKCERFILLAFLIGFLIIAINHTKLQTCVRSPYHPRLTKEETLTFR